ncbi:hypothetical protein [Mesorhizobium sp. ES1-3]|uniref:hypothetical protein n=1 Tax=Mesorhizobium sp. ES1-3 TaxID=2876628 RepID=UPI001CCA8C80|nr:hypothetical protein [Mesorhizobium sp. ES1-3]MBZ9673175.1 hypothetical protein [Mesorhizobium sp. ES1-3]
MKNLGQGASFGFEDRLVAVVVGECDLDRAVVKQFSRAIATDLVHLVEARPCEEYHIGAIAEIEASLQSAKGDLAVVARFNGDSGAIDKVEMIAIQRSASTIRQRPTNLQPAKAWFDCCGVFGCSAINIAVLCSKRTKHRRQEGTVS